MPIYAARGARTCDVFYIQNVSGSASRLKSWLVRFNGDASHHLTSNRGWRRLNEGEADRFTRRDVPALAHASR